MPSGKAKIRAGRLVGDDLLNRIKVPGATAYFGIAYSIMTYSGTFKGLGINPMTWGKLVKKGFEDGHATTFMIDGGRGEFTMTGIAEDAWVFYGGPLNREDWARKTPNCTTYLYYVTGDDIPARYQEVRNELEPQSVRYSELGMNITGTRYENCISSSHLVTAKMGYGHMASLQQKGWWIPSFSNYMTWFATRLQSWEYKRVDNCNTHIPD